MYNLNMSLLYVHSKITNNVCIYIYCTYAIDILASAQVRTAAAHGHCNKTASWPKPNSWRLALRDFIPWLSRLEASVLAPTFCVELHRQYEDALCLVTSEHELHAYVGIIRKTSRLLQPNLQNTQSNCYINASCGSYIRSVHVHMPSELVWARHVPVYCYTQARSRNR